MCRMSMWFTGVIYCVPIAGQFYTNKVPRGVQVIIVLRYRQNWVITFIQGTVLI